MPPPDRQILGLSHGCLLPFHHRPHIYFDRASTCSSSEPYCCLWAPDKILRCTIECNKIKVFHSFCGLHVLLFLRVPLCLGPKHDSRVPADLYEGSSPSSEWDSFPRPTQPCLAISLVVVLTGFVFKVHPVSSMSEIVVLQSPLLSSVLQSTVGNILFWPCCWWVQPYRM